MDEPFWVVSNSKFGGKMNTSMRKQFLFQFSTRQLELQGSPRAPREALVFSNTPKKSWQIPLSQSQQTEFEPILCSQLPGDSSLLAKGAKGAWRNIPRKTDGRLS